MYSHDQCHNTGLLIKTYTQLTEINSFFSLYLDQYERAGQNIGRVGTRPNEPITSEAIPRIIRLFFDENTDASMNDVNSFSGTKGAK